MTEGRVWGVEVHVGAAPLCPGGPDEQRQGDARHVNDTNETRHEGVDTTPVA